MQKSSWVVLGCITIAAMALEWWPHDSTTGNVTSSPVAESVENTSSATTAVSVTSEAKPIAMPAPSTPAHGDPAIRAQISPLNYTTISAELPARVARLAVREGDAFTRGQVLVSFDCAAQNAQLDKARATSQIADRNEATQARLYELQSVSRIDADNARSEALRAHADVRELTAVVSRCDIRAPFAGRVGEQKIRQEQFVQVGQPLLEVMASGALELEFIVPSAWLRWLKSGSTFEVTIDETGRSYKAKVTRIGAQIDAVSQTVKITGVIVDNHPDLKPGMSGAVRMHTPATGAQPA